jgi:phosphoribosyl 1,2-cyclic phosphodiesterase
VKVTLWGTRGSHAGPGPDTVRYGGHTACVEVRGEDGSVLVLDAGTGAKPLGGRLAESSGRVDLLLTHLHMDHVQGLGFFAPLFTPGREVHIWGPPTPTHTLRSHLARYMSPPLFPVRLRDLPCDLHVHDVGDEHSFRVGALEVHSALIIHPGRRRRLPHQRRRQVDGIPAGPRTGARLASLPRRPRLDVGL